MTALPVSSWTGREMNLCGPIATTRVIIALLATLTVAMPQIAADDARPTHGDGSIVKRGTPQVWHTSTFSLSGPFARETDTDPNPFRDYRLTMTFTHPAIDRAYIVPGYFAADGNAAETSATEGTVWRTHFTPDRPGTWRYRISFVSGRDVALKLTGGTPLAPYDGLEGTLQVASGNKSGRGFRTEGRLQYVGERYLRFAGSGRYFIKAGADAPETLLAYADFDGTETRKAPLKTWQPHVRDWQQGDPTWQGGKGKGLIGALNYLSGTGCNAFSFLTYNAGGDGENVWPYVSHDDPLHFDCSKLDQWGIIFDHAQDRGLYLHFKLQETENDDNRRGHREESTREVPAALDGGDVGPERRLYLRELIARYGHALALNWNLGEENTQSPEQQREMASWIHDVDPYDHHIVIHTFPDQQDKVYPQLLGDNSVLTGASLQNSWKAAHARTLKWIRASSAAGRPWVVANDEQNPADQGVPPDPGYEGHDGWASDKQQRYNLHDIRRETLWGTLMAGGAGVEYYFGYKLPQNDLICEDWRSRARTWEYCRIALEFFARDDIPFWEMDNTDELVGNPQHRNTVYCLAKPGSLYLVARLDRPESGGTRLDLSGADGNYTVHWFNPREGGKDQAGTVNEVTAGSVVDLGEPPDEQEEDWIAIVRRR